MVVKIARVFLFLLTGVVMVYVDTLTALIAHEEEVSTKWAWVVNFVLTILGLFIYLGVDGGIVKVFAKKEEKKDL